MNIRNIKRPSFQTKEQDDFFRALQNELLDCHKEIERLQQTVSNLAKIVKTRNV
jgi:ribosomal protein S18